MDWDEFNRGIGQRISQARDEVGISAEKLAEGAGISMQTLSGLECGRRTCKTTTFYKICRELGVSADYILGLTELDTKSDINTLLPKLSDKELILVEKFIRNMLEVNHS